MAYIKLVPGRIPSKRLVGISATALAFLLQACARPPGADLNDLNSRSCIADVQAIASQLFDEVRPESHESLAEQGADLKVLRRRGVSVKISSLKTLMRMAPGTRFALPLFNERNVEIEVEMTTMQSLDNIVLTGRVVGDSSGTVTLVMRNGVLIGNIHTHALNEHFEIRYDGAGIHKIQEVTLDHEDDCAATENDESLATYGEEDHVVSYVATNPVVDMLVAYTTKAKVAQGGVDAIHALIQMGIADTNRSFSESKLSLTVRLVGTMEVKSLESNDFSSDLAALKGTTDGRWDEVHAARTRLGADQVSLIGEYTGTRVAGIGYINSSKASAFTITKPSGFSNFTFTHELGHNIGLNHSDGYESSAGKFRTIMAYGSHPRIRRFSSPNLTYNGYVTGTSTKNSVSIINANASRIAGFNAEVVPRATPTPTPTPKPTPTPTPTPVPKPSPTVTPMPTATPKPSPTVTPMPTATPKPSPTATPAPAPTATPVATATPTPTATPSATPAPTTTPRPEPSATPSPTPIPESEPNTPLKACA